MTRAENVSAAIASDTISLNNNHKAALRIVLTPQEYTFYALGFSTRVAALRFGLLAQRSSFKSVGPPAIWMTSKRLDRFVTTVFQPH